MVAALTGAAMSCAGSSAETVATGDRAVVYQAKADDARARAADLAREGGWAYKSGAIDRANRDAVRFQQEADSARAASNGTPGATGPYASRELADAQARLDDLRKAGGWAYKSGAVARAEAEVRALSPAPPTTEPYVSRELADAQARLDDLRKAGGWAYKSGAVARAEAEVQALSPVPPTVNMGLKEEVKPPPNWGKPVERTMRTYR
jgi:hypothetical protein